MRKTTKSKLLHIIYSRLSKIEISEDPRANTVFIVDVMALIRTMTDLPDTFEKFVWNFLSYIPKGYHRVDLVADCISKIPLKMQSEKQEDQRHHYPTLQKFSLNLHRQGFPMSSLQSF